MTAKELLIPRFELIADYPTNTLDIGTIIECSIYYNDFTIKHWIDKYKKYPHLFRRLHWWEKRTEEQMPKKLMSLADNRKDTFDIEEWNMGLSIGWINKKSRSCCDLLLFNPEYGYIPVD